MAKLQNKNVQINFSNEISRNLNREPLVLPDGRKFLILDANISAYGIPMDVAPNENGNLPVYELNFDSSIVSEPVVYDEDSGRNYLTLSGRVIKAHYKKTISANVIEATRRND